MTFKQNFTGAKIMKIGQKTKEKGNFLGVLFPNCLILNRKGGAGGSIILLYCVVFCIQ